MDTLTSCFQSFTIDPLASLKHDLTYIIECYCAKQLQLDTRKFISQPRQYGEPQELFIIICNIFPNLLKDGEYIDLLDIMPYIDEYLEYYS